MRFLLFLAGSLVSLTALHAEGVPVTVPPGSYVVPPAQAVDMNPGRVQDFDKDFFTDKPPTPAATDPTGRYVGEDPDYNSGQRKQWLDSCASKKDKDPQGIGIAIRERRRNPQKGSNKVSTKWRNASNYR